jgi:hypothetical protein
MSIRKKSSHFFAPRKEFLINCTTFFFHCFADSFQTSRFPSNPSLWFVFAPKRSITIPKWLWIYDTRANLRRERKSQIINAILITPTIIQMLFSLPIHMSLSPLEATLHSFQYKKRLHAAAGSTVEGKTSCTFSRSFRAHKFLLRVEKFFFFRMRQLKQLLIYLEPFLYGGRRAKKEA